MTAEELAALVKLVARGDRDALQRLIVHYHTPLRRALEARVEPSLRHHIDPDDVLQEAYVNAFNAIVECHFDSPAGLYKWLETIAACRLKDQERALRRQKRDVGREVRGRRETTASYPDLVHRVAGDESTPSRRIARNEAIAAVMSSLARLGDDQRRVVRMRYLEGQSVAEVAKRLGKTEAAIHMLCHRGLKSLRELMVSITRYLTRL
jgi:RNA polymerase sigma-70 factor (ECF subfamily)